MKPLSRFGVSIETSLLNQFDKSIEKAGYVGRSEAFRDLIRTRLVEEEIQNSDSNILGVLTLVYDHHRRQVEKQLTSIQHDYHHNIISTTHVHIDHDNCLEVILLKGKTKIVKKIGSLITSQKGVKYTKLILTSTIKDPHHHA
jgi:CopG family transcriptional regulator, nickel-responsive regulator